MPRQNHVDVDIKSQSMIRGEGALLIPCDTFDSILTAEEDDLYQVVIDN